MKWKWWWLKPRLSYAEAYARAMADIEREHPIDQVRAMNRMKNLQRQIAREELRHRLDGGGEYERGIKGMQ